MHIRTLVLFITLAATSNPAVAGIYAGLSIGHAWSDNTVQDRDGFSNEGFPGYTVDYRDDGATIGIVAGYSVQLDGWLIGVELDTTRGEIEANSLQIDPVGLDEEISTRSELFATLQLRIGRQTGNWLTFASAGYAISSFENELFDLDFGDVHDLDDSYFDDSSDDGWVAGIGVEYLVNKHWRARMDAQYMEFGTRAHYVNRETSISRSGVLVGIKKYDSENRLTQVRLGFSYHF